MTQKDVEKREWSYPGSHAVEKTRVTSVWLKLLLDLSSQV
jgi:hypothetical protein